MAFDVEKWLTDEMGFTAEEAKSLAPSFTSRSDKLEKGYLRQSDYSRQMNDLKKLEQQLADNNEKLNADMAEFATLTAGEQEQATALRRRIEQAEEKAFKLTQRIEAVAAEPGRDVKELLGEIEPAPKPKKEEPAAFDPKPLQQQIGGVANYLLDLNAVIDDIADEHQRLTGQRFNRREFIAGIKADIAAGKTDNIDPVRRWEQKFDIPTKRTEAANKAVEDRIAAARAEERAAVLSEQALPGEPRPGEHAPVFRVGGESKVHRPQPGSRLTGAISALATGKYRTKTNAA